MTLPKDSSKKSKKDLGHNDLEVGFGIIPEELARGFALLEGSSKVCLLTHVSPDPDAYGSLCGLANYLRRPELKKVVALINADAREARLRFLPGSEDVVEGPPSGYRPDLIVVLDCGDLIRVGDELAQWVRESGVPVLNIDHHQSNPNFGVLNLVSTTASSTCEIVFELLEHWRASSGELSSLEFGTKVAHCLLAGILGDTGGFRYRSTSARTLTLAAQLIRYGADLPSLAQELFGSVPVATARLNSAAIERMHIFAGGKIAGACLTEDDYARVGASAEDGESIAEILRDLEGVEVSYSLRWMKGKWKASLRTSRSDIDLSIIAQSFGGGGHKAAAAFRASGELVNISKELESKLEQALRSAEQNILVGKSDVSS